MLRVKNSGVSSLLTNTFKIVDSTLLNFFSGLVGSAAAIPIMASFGEKWLDRKILLSTQKALQRSSHYYEKRAQAIEDLNDAIIELEDAVAALVPKNKIPSEISVARDELHLRIYTGYKILRKKQIFISVETKSIIQDTVEFANEMNLLAHKIILRMQQVNYDPDEVVNWKEELFQKYLSFKVKTESLQTSLSKEISV